jgi:hypothetical protein
VYNDECITKYWSRVTMGTIDFRGTVGHCTLHGGAMPWPCACARACVRLGKWVVVRPIVETR